MNGLRKQSFGLGGHPFLVSRFFLNHLYRQSLAKTVSIKSLLMNGCGWSPKSILDGCKNSWVNFFSMKTKYIQLLCRMEFTCLSELKSLILLIWIPCYLLLLCRLELHPSFKQSHATMCKLQEPFWDIMPMSTKRTM